MYSIRRNADGTQTTSIRRTSSRSHGSYTETAWSAETSRETENGFNLGIRFTPRNRWLAKAERGAASAGTRIAKAELREKEVALACDIAEAAIRIAYRERMVKVARIYAGQCEIVRNRLSQPFESGHIPRSDYTDACRRYASARADLGRLSAQKSDQEAQFRMLTGLAPEQLDLSRLRADGLCPVKIPSNDMDRTTLFIALAAQRPDILMAEATAAQRESEWKQARSKRVPWLSHMGLSYSWADENETSEKTFGSSRSASGRSSSSSVENESPTMEVEERQTVGSESESRQSWGSGDATAERSGHEWWFEIGAEIPLFEWLSPESKKRRHAIDEIRRALGPLRCRALNELQMTGSAMTTSRNRLDAMRKFVVRERRALRHLAGQAATESVKGQIEALAVEGCIADMALRLFDVAEQSALAEVQFCRVSGVLPCE